MYQIEEQFFRSIKRIHELAMEVRARIKSGRSQKSKQSDAQFGKANQAKAFRELCLAWEVLNSGQPDLIKALKKVDDAQIDQLCRQVLENRVADYLESDSDPEEALLGDVQYAGNRIRYATALLGG